MARDPADLQHGTFVCAGARKYLPGAVSERGSGAVSDKTARTGWLYLPWQRSEAVKQKAEKEQHLFRNREIWKLLLPMMAEQLLVSFRGLAERRCGSL